MLEGMISFECIPKDNWLRVSKSERNNDKVHYC